MDATITVGGLSLFAEGMRNPLIHRKKRKKNHPFPEKTEQSVIYAILPENNTQQR